MNGCCHSLLLLLWQFFFIQYWINKLMDCKLLILYVLFWSVLPGVQTYVVICIALVLNRHLNLQATIGSAACIAVCLISYAPYASNNDTSYYFTYWIIQQESANKSHFSSFHWVSSESLIHLNLGNPNRNLEYVFFPSDCPNSSLQFFRHLLFVPAMPESFWFRFSLNHWKQKCKDAESMTPKVWISLQTQSGWEAPNCFNVARLKS